MVSRRSRLSVVAAGAVILAGLSLPASPAAGADAPQTLDAEALLAYARSLPPPSGGSSTGPGGATFPGLATAAAAPPVDQDDGSVPVTATPALPDIAPLTVAANAPVRPNQVIVLFQPGATADVAETLAQANGLRVQSFRPSVLLGTALVLLQIPDGRTPASVADTLRADPRVRAVQGNFIYRPATDPVPRQTAFPQYALDVIRVEAAQLAAHATHQPVIAVIDTGIDATHPDLLGSIADRFEAVGDGKWDSGSHGTGIAGNIAAHGQLLGVAPRAKLLSIRAFPVQDQKTGEATSDGLMRGLDWAVEQRVDIINMSLAGPEDPIVDAAVTAAIVRGFVVVAAAGNDGAGAPPAHPAAVKGVIAVTATDQRDGLFARANHGDYITLAAPGVDIISDAPGGAFNLVTGTSQAAAHVTGVIALLRSIRPNLTPMAVHDVLTRTAVDLGPPGRDDKFGAGRVDADAAVRAVSNIRLIKQ